MRGRSRPNAPRRLGVAVGAWLVLSILPGCTTKATRAIYERPLPSTEDERIFLVATRQKERIERSLGAAGFALTDDPLATKLFLRVTLGNEKGFRECGTLNNVKFALRHTEQPVLELVAAGWTGTCEPNVLDDMSHELMRRFAASGR